MSGTDFYTSDIHPFVHKKNTMSLRTIFLLLATLLYFVGAHWFYTQKVAGICCGDAAASAAVIQDDDKDEIIPLETDIDPASTLGPLTFNWLDSTAVTGDGFEDYKSEIANNLTEYNVLEITGHYFADEDESLGFARARQVKGLLTDMIPGNRILVNSKLIDDIEGMQENLFEAVEFNWIDKSINIEETTVVEFDEDRFMIFFPFNSNIKDTNKEVEDKLDVLAGNLVDSGRNITITGHTDSTGDSKFNYRLGLDRAFAIKKLLMSKGVNKEQIKINSKGESQPIGSNRTKEGEHKNRRVVIKILN